MRYGAIALAVMAVLGLAVAFLSGSLTPSGTIANEVSETTGDAYVCGTSTSVNDPSVDIDSVSIRQVKGGWEVTVSMGPSMETIYADSFSAAVEVRLGIYTGLYQVHNGVLTINNATLTTEFLIFFFAVLLPFEVNLKVDSFHQAEDGDPVNCDTAFLEDATSGKTTPTASPTATEEQEATPTPTSTIEQASVTPTPTTTPSTATATPTDTPEPATATATPPQKEPPTATPTPTAPQPPTATPTATNTPELFKLLIAKNDTDQGFGLAVHVAGWEMKVFAGDGCTGSPVASGLTSRRTIVPGLPFDPLDLVTNGYSVQLPAGAYSVAETQQQGWERVSGTFCQNVQVPEDSFVTFRNRRTRDGDVNKDGVTNSIDVVLVLQVIAGLIPEQPNTVKADVNRDRMVNAIDTALMLQFEAGLIPSLPVVPDDN